MAAARRLLDETTFTAAVQKGESMSLEQVIAYVLD
jgi:hypothetical protein